MALPFTTGLHPASPRVRPLVWIGAAQSHLQALDLIQRKAMKIIGYQTRLLTLATCRLVSSLTYFYKPKCISGPAQLKSMVPPPALPTPHQQTVPNKEIAHVSTFLSTIGSLAQLLEPFISLLCPQLLELTSSEHYPATIILEGSAAVQDNGLPPPLSEELDAVN